MTECLPVKSSHKSLIDAWGRVHLLNIVLSEVWARQAVCVAGSGAGQGAWRCVGVWVEVNWGLGGTHIPLARGGAL